MTLAERKAIPAGLRPMLPNGYPQVDTAELDRMQQAGYQEQLRILGLSNSATLPL